jgi:hypothetical protein
MKKSLISFCCLLIAVGGLFVFQGFQAVSSNTVFNKQSQQLDKLLSTKKYLVLGSKSQQIKVVSKSDTQKYPGYEVYKKHKNVVFLSKGKPGKEIVFFEKFIPLNFTDYSRKVYVGKLKLPTIPEESYLNNYKENIITECNAGINFAGYYTIVSFGCGTACQQNLIINRKTGKIDGEFVTSMGSKFKKNSSLILKNYGAIDKKTSLIELYGRLEVNHINWSGKALKKID